MMSSGKHDVRYSGVIVKYHPCSRYARGSQCLKFRPNKCDQTPLICKSPEYDKWYKDVLKGKIKCFYPKSIRLLETPNMPMFLFHVHHHAIVGEAKISSSTIENSEHFYWFNKFYSYPNLVQLELLRTDPRLPRLAKRGRWTLVNIKKETIDEIRILSKLPEEERKKLGVELEKIVEEMTIIPLYMPTWELYMKNECEMLATRYEFNKRVLSKSQKYFSKAIKKKLSSGRSLEEIFYASLYLAIRMLKIPILLSDVAIMSGIRQTKLGKAYRLIARTFNLTVPPLNPELLIKSYSEKANISKKTLSRAIAHIRNVQKKKILQSVSPPSLAAVTLSIACKETGERITQKHIAEIFGISVVTIRNSKEKIKTFLNASNLAPICLDQNVEFLKK